MNTTIVFDFLKPIHHEENHIVITKETSYVAGANDNWNRTRRVQTPLKEIITVHLIISYTLPERYAIPYHDISCKILRSNAVSWFGSV